MTAPDRPTREQVEFALKWSGLAGSAASILAAEVRALRAELDDSRAGKKDRARWASWLDQSADEADDLSNAERLGLRVAATHLLDVEVAARVSTIDLDPDAIRDLYERLWAKVESGRAALVARTPQPAESCTRCAHRVAPGCPDCLPSPAGEVPPTADLLRAAAAGRREYAGKGDVPGADTLLTEAATLDLAAQVADGDMGPLYGWLPSWRWTAGMERRVRSSTRETTVRADVAGLAAPLPAVPDGEDTATSLVCGDTSGPNGVGGECVLPPGHPHMDGIGGRWGSDGEDAVIADRARHLDRYYGLWVLDDKPWDEMSHEEAYKLGQVFATRYIARQDMFPAAEDGEDVPARLDAAAEALGGAA